VLHYIEQLQKKPEAVRKKVLVAVLAISMGIIVLVWLSTLPVRFGTIAGETEDASGPSPFSVIAERTKALSADFNSGIEQLKEQFGG